MVCIVMLSVSCVYKSSQSLVQQLFFSSSKSTRSPAACCFSNGVSVWVAPAFIKSNDLIKAGATQTETSLLEQHAAGQWTCGFAWWLWFPSKNHHWKSFSFLTIERSGICGRTKATFISSDMQFGLSEQNCSPCAPQCFSRRWPGW